MNYNFVCTIFGLSKLFDQNPALPMEAESLLPTAILTQTQLLGWSILFHQIYSQLRCDFVQLLMTTANVCDRNI